MVPPSRAPPPRRAALSGASFRRRTPRNPRGGRLVRSLVDGGQPRAVIGDVDCEQACRFGRARVLADEMLAAGRLEEAFPRPVDLGGTGRGILRADRP